MQGLLIGLLEFSGLVSGYEASLGLGLVLLLCLLGLVMLCISRVPDGRWGYLCSVWQGDGWEVHRGNPQVQRQDCIIELFKSSVFFVGDHIHDLGMCRAVCT